MDEITLLKHPKIKEMTKMALYKVKEIDRQMFSQLLQPKDPRPVEPPYGVRFFAPLGRPDDSHGTG